MADMLPFAQAAKQDTLPLRLPDPHPKHSSAPMIWTAQVPASGFLRWIDFHASDISAVKNVRLLDASGWPR